MHRILVVSRGVHEVPKSGGADNLSYLYAESVAGMCDKVAFIGRGKQVTGSPVKFIPVKARFSADSRFCSLYFLKSAFLSLLVTLKAIKFLRKNSVSVVHSNSSITTSLVKLFFPGIPVVYTIHDQLSTRDSGTTGIESLDRVVINRLLELHAARVANRLIAVSDFIKGQLIQYGIPESKISVLYSTSTVERDRKPELPLLEANDSTKYILSVGEQNGRKRFDRLIQALRHLDPEVKLVLVGNGPRRPLLVNIARSLGVEDRVIFKDFVSRSELLDLYANSSLYVMVSEREGFPISIVESLFSGTRAMYFTEKNNSAFNSIPESPYLQIYGRTDAPFIGRGIRNALDEIDEGYGLTRKDTISWAKSIFPSEREMGERLVRMYSTCAKAEEPIPVPQSSM